MPRTVLIVDDNAAERVLLAEYLRHDYDVLAATGGKEMIAVLREKARSISAIVLDLVMPEMDGFEALRRIRANAIYRQIPVIVASSLSDEDSQVSALSLGASGYAYKPYNREIILRLLENTINLREKSALTNTFRRDVLTGLPNRARFFEMVESMIKRREPGYYILSCFDIENFKVINDQYGVETGDKVLRAIAEIIDQGITALGGACCRYSADNFGLIYPASLKDSDEIKALHVKAAVPEVLGRNLRIRIGRYLVDDLSVPVSAMYDRANLAEESIRGRYDRYVADYNDSMRTRLLNEQKMINDMRRALSQGEFEPWLQPQYNHATGALIGAEALVRWRRDGQFISPAEFVPLFERNGFIYEMDRYIWEQVCILLRRWLDEGRTPLPVSVNISRRDLFHKHSVEVLDDLVKKYDIPYDMLRLEVTESAFSESTGQIVDRVCKLIELGFVVEIDDFGSGYSSLNTLKDVPASILKLDMKFFENTKNQQRGGNIVESVVRMAKWLGMSVIAEGVEEKSQADYLKSIGCYYIQGFYYAKPMPVPDYERLLDESEKEPELAGLKTIKTLDNNEFWNPKSMETLIFNSFVGGACIFEYCKGKTEMLRVNDQYVRQFGHLMPGSAPILEKSPLRFMDAENKKIFFDGVERAIRNQEEASCELTLSSDSMGAVIEEYVRIALRPIACAGARHLIYCAITNMTEQRIAEKKQREAEEKQNESVRQLQVIMDNVSGGVSVIQINDDATSYLVFSNERYYELYGCTREQAQSQKLDVMRCIVPDDLPKVMQAVRKLKQDGVSTVIDYRIIRCDGKLAFLRANTSRMYMAGYGVVLASVVTDITEQQELSEKFRAVVENINGGVSAVYLREGKPCFVVVNKQYFDLIGYTPEQFDAEVSTVFDLIYPDDRERVEKLFEQAGKRPEPYTMEYRIVRRDGAVRSVLCNTNVIRLFGVDEPVQLAVSNDITELRLAQQRERDAVERLTAVLNHAGNGVTALALYPDAPEFLFVNDKYYQIIGYTREAYDAAIREDLLAVIHPDDREAIRERVMTLNKDGGAGTLEYRTIRQDGGTVWVRSVVTITRLEGVEAPVQIGIFSDVTREREATAQLHFLNETARGILAQPDSEAAIHDTLERLMHYFDGDRAYVIEFNYAAETSSNTYETCAPGVTSQRELLQGVPFSVSQYWMREMQNDCFLDIRNVDALGADKARLRALLQEQQIRSLIAAPLWSGGRLIGFIGIDDPRAAVQELDSLKAVGDYVAVLLARRDLNREIEFERDAMHQMMNDMPGGFLRLEIHGNAAPSVVTFSDGLCGMMGLSRQEAMAAYGSDVGKALEGEDLNVLRAKAQERMDEDGQFVGHCHLRRRGRTSLHVQAACRFVKNMDGRMFLNVHLTDISRRLQAQEQQKALLDNLCCGAALYEYDGRDIRVIHINKSYWELVGRDPVDYSKASVFNAVHPDDLAVLRLEIEAAIRQKRNASVCIRVLNGEGGYKPFRAEARVRPQKEGKFLLFTAYTPITEQVMSVQQMLPIALSTVMSTSEDASYLKDKELRYLCCSQSMADALGMESVRDIIGKNDFELFEPAIARGLREHDLETLSHGATATRYTERVAVRDGGTSLVSTAKYPVVDADGSVVGLYGVSRDITDQREKESQLELLTRSIPGGIAAYAIDENGVRMQYFNDGFYKFSGCTREEYARAVAKDPLSFVFEEDKHVIRAMIEGFREHRQDGHVNGAIYRCHTKDGGYRWMSMKTVLSKQEDGTFTVNAVQFDITEQQEEKERLRVSEELNRIAIEQSGGVTARYDVATRRLLLPKTLNPVFALPQVVERLPDGPVEQGWISPDTQADYRQMFAAIDRGEKSGCVAYKRRTVDGWRWLEARYTTVFSSSGSPVSAVISFTDITQRLEKEVVYSKWQQSLQDRSKSSYTLFRCNLTRGVFYDSREGELLDIRYEDENLSFEQLTAQYVAQKVRPEDKAAYSALMDADRLLAGYHRGRRSHTLDYRETREKDFRWLRLSIDLVEYPNSKDVEIYIMYEDIDKQKRAELLTLERSLTDPLTGVYNRAAFIEKTEAILSASRPDENHALLMLDVDNFKSVNDTMGHSAGDALLTELTAKIRAVLRHDDLLGRMGGDEFFVFLKDVLNEDAAAAKARQICALALSPPGSGVEVTVSIGAAMLPRDGNDFDTVYRKVDKALYSQKARGKNGLLFVED